MGNGEGTMFGDYLLLHKLDTGGMGEIFLAKKVGAAGFEKLVVIKRVLAQHLDNEDFIQMFEQEAKITAKLNHANIVQVNELGEIGDSFFSAMEFIHGRGLDNIIDRCKKMKRHIHPAHIVEILTGVCAGLSYAHNLRDENTGEPLRIIHRDVNPSNIMISYNGGVKVIDFGIAKSEINENKTETGTLKGKFVYMSPEQSAAKKLDKRSDIFPIGICLYQLCKYDNPFAKPNIVLSLQAIQEEQPPDLDGEYACFNDILHKSLEKDPDKRYADCRDMQNDLQRLLLSGAVTPCDQTLADFMCELFANELAKDREAHKKYAAMHAPAKDQSSPNLATMGNEYSAASNSGPSSSGNIPLNNMNVNNSGSMNIPTQVGAVPGQPWMNNGYNQMMGMPSMNNIPYGMGQDPTTGQYIYNQMGMPPVYQQPQKSNKAAIIITVSVALLIGVAVSAFIIKGGANGVLGGGGQRGGGITAVNNLQPVETSGGGIQAVEPSSEDKSKQQPPVAANPNNIKANKPVEQKIVKPVEQKVVVKEEQPKAEPPKAEPIKTEEPQKVEPTTTPKVETKVVNQKVEEPKKETPKKEESKKTEPKKTEQPKKEVKAPEPEPEPAPSGPAGSIMVVANPSTRVKIDGAAAGWTPVPKYELKKQKGIIQVGDSNSPFDIKITYKANGAVLTYTVNSEPGCVLKFGGTALGKTPQTVTSKGGVDKFECADPAAGTKMNVNLRFTAGK